ncbi:MAG: hypothetical protein K1X78_18535 [Verrucomicrobiaceae bacterium]|nr:hypothetical protein [Verrucomicrobiaceae bacterium]
MSDGPGRWRSFAIIFGVAAAYALALRLLFAAQPLEGWLQIVSIAFVWTVPISSGALICYLGNRFDRPRLFWALGAPPLTMLVLMIGAVAVKLEALMCAVVSAPVVIPASIFGGMVMHFILLYFSDRGRMMVNLFVLLPLAMSPLEQVWKEPHEQRVMHDSVLIHADAKTIWRHIYEVPAIQREELPEQWIYLLGFPRPIAATIDRQGVGGRRHATFERDVSFFEVVTNWEPEKKLSFTIKADPDFIPHTAFDQHVIVGGRFYNVLDGAYEIEPKSDGSCVLHLSSTHRLSTRFNWYTGWWSEWVMAQVQGSILEVIRKRCERRSV